MEIFIGALKQLKTAPTFPAETGIVRFAGASSGRDGRE
jgi:hypothetical protein